MVSPYKLVLYYIMAFFFLFLFNVFLRINGGSCLLFACLFIYLLTCLRVCLVVYLFT